MQPMTAAASSSATCEAGGEAVNSPMPGGQPQREAACSLQVLPMLQRCVQVDGCCPAGKPSTHSRLPAWRRAGSPGTRTAGRPWWRWAASAGAGCPPPAGRAPCPSAAPPAVGMLRGLCSSRLYAGVAAGLGAAGRCAHTWAANWRLNDSTKRVRSSS